MAAFIVINSFLAITLPFLLIGCSDYYNQEATPYLFETKAQALKAAKKINCKGAHKMGDKWMPCDSHEDNIMNKQGSSHGHHHHNH